MSKKTITFLLTAILLVVFFITQITFFVVQPIGAVPGGKTIVIIRMNKTKFIDSADAMCAREMNGVSLLCRGIMTAAIVKKGTILARLPYSKLLYNISTDGKIYGR
jgi:hypothetical protein